MLLALVLRIWGATYAFPNLVINDESAFVYGALKMLEFKTFIPAFHPEEFKALYYFSFIPSLYAVVFAPFLLVAYLFSSFSSLADFKLYLTLDPSVIWIAARIFSAVFGTLTVYLVYRLALLWFENKKIALFSALFLALSLFHIQLSHMARHWIYGAFFATLAWIFIALIYKSGQRKHYFWGGVSAGLSFGATPPSALVLLPLGFLHFLKQKFVDRNLVISGVSFLALALLFIFLHPYGLTLGDTGSESGILANVWERLSHPGERSPFGFLGLAGHFLEILWRSETFLLIFAALGAVFFFKRDLRLGVSVFLFFISYIFLMYTFFTALPRAVLVILPLGAVLAGLGLGKFTELFERKILIKSFVIAVIFILPLLSAARYDYLLSAADTRTLATAWIRENIPAGNKILAYLPVMRLANTKEGINKMEKLDAKSLRAADRALLKTKPEFYPEPAFEILNLHFLPGYSVSPEGFQYLVLEYEKADQSDIPPGVRELVFNARLLKRFESQLEFKDEISALFPWEFFEIQRFGPFVDIYEF